MTFELAVLGLPSNYWVATLSYVCESCGSTFEWRAAEGTEMVRFVTPDGGEERWLPTHGQGGYLELLERFVPGFAQHQTISVIVTREFSRRLSAVQLKSPSGAEFSIDERDATCPRCRSKDIRLLGKMVDSNPPLEWLRYCLREGQTDEAAEPSEKR
jgi:DNA-directed RNA polymerase subunit RPC12/RpoP